MKPYDYSTEKPDLVFHLTDTAGGPTSIFQREDPEAQITIHIRSGHHNVVRIFNMFGREHAIPYIVEETQRVAMDKIWDGDFRGKIGLVCNAAPRTEQGVNGVEFLTAFIGDRFVGGRLHVVGLPSAFSLVSDKIQHGVYRLPNKNNGRVFPTDTQFRSSYVEAVLSDPQSLVPAKLSDIPGPPEYPTLAYVDAFGNMKFGVPNREAFESQLRQSAIKTADGTIVGLRVGDTRCDVQLALDGEQLSGLLPGATVLYVNSDRRDRFNLVWKWTPGATAQEKQRNSPYAKFGEPPEGSEISIR